MKYLDDFTITELRNMSYKEPEDKSVHIVVIVPMKSSHESGYRNMKYILLDKKHNITGVVGGSSDLIQITKTSTRDLVMDCLKRSGCLRLYMYDENFNLSMWKHSTFAIYE